MVISKGFDFLHFTECLIHGFSVEENSICLDISNVYLLNEHPQFVAGQSSLKGKLCFEKVLSSKRGITEYIRDSSGNVSYKDEYIVEDVLPNKNIGKNEYFIEGILESPEAWLDWRIVADTFYFEV